MMATPTLDSAPSGIAAASDGDVWYAEQAPSYIARVLPNGHQREYVLPAQVNSPFDLAVDALGNVWFGDWTGVDRFGNPTGPALARMTPAGIVHETPLASPCQPYGPGVDTYLLTPDSSADIWFADACRGLLGFSTQQFKLTQYATTGLNGLAMAADSSVWGGNIGEVVQFARDGSVLATFSGLHADSGIAWGSDGHVWFLSNWAGSIGSLDPKTGQSVVYAFPNCSCNRSVGNLTAGADGALWFTEGMTFGSSSYPGGVGRVTTAGVYTEYRTYEPRSQPVAITFDTKGRLWLADYGANKIGHFP